MPEIKYVSGEMIALSVAQGTNLQDFDGDWPNNYDLFFLFWKQAPV